MQKIKITPDPTDRTCEQMTVSSPDGRHVTVRMDFSEACEPEDFMAVRDAAHKSACAQLKMRS
jgi:hypothetical protein